MIPSGSPKISIIKTLLNRVVLLKQIPGGQEANYREIETALINSVLHAAILERFCVCHQTDIGDLQEHLSRTDSQQLQGRTAHLAELAEIPEQILFFTVLPNTA